MRRTLRGEIVDSKCFVGVMKPGRGKVHRACATLCIRGGIPPLLVVAEDGGALAYYLLVGPDGRTLDPIAAGLVAEPIEITGDVIELDDLRVLKATPAHIRRLPAA